MSTLLKKLTLTFGCALLFVSANTIAGANDCDPCCDSCWGNWILYGEWLYLRPCADGIYVALRGESDIAVVLSGENFGKVSVKNFDYELDSGFRLGIGYSNPNCYCWDVTLDWTSYSPSVDDKVKVKEPGGSNDYLFPFFCEDFLFSAATSTGQPGSTDPAQREFFIDVNARAGTEVKAHWDLDSHLVDFKFSFPFCLNECFRLIPHIGLRYAHIDQELSSKSTFAFVTSTRFLRQKFRSCFDGVGPRGGFGVSWDLGCGFGIYGDFAFTVAYGETEADYKNSQNSFLNADGSKFLDFFLNKYHAKSDNCCSRFISDMGFGASWSTTFCECAKTSVRLGWEHHMFFNQGVADGVAGCLVFTKEEDSDLSAQGLVLGFGVEF